MSSAPEPPERIWLQPHMGHRIDEWTWCHERIEDDTDIEYVRADLYDSAVEQVRIVSDKYAALEQELAEAKERRSEAERMGETWLRQRQPDKYGPTKPEGEK